MELSFNLNNHCQSDDTPSEDGGPETQIGAVLVRRTDFHNARHQHNQPFGYDRSHPKIPKVGNYLQGIEHGLKLDMTQHKGLIKK